MRVVEGAGGVSGVAARDAEDDAPGLGGPVGRGECEPVVCAPVLRSQVSAHGGRQVTSLAEVEAVHTNKPVRRGDQLGHQ